MRKHFVIPALLVLFALCTSQAFAQAVTIVTRSGERFRAQAADIGNRAGFTVRMKNGRDGQIPMSDIAMIDFTADGRNVDQNEVQRADQAGDNGLIVLRNGRTMAGRLVDVPPNRNAAVVSGTFGERTLPFNQIARIYPGAGGYGRNGYGSNRYGNNDGYRRNGQSDPYNEPDGTYGNNRPNRNGGQNRQQNGQQNGNPRQSNGFGNGGRSLTVPSNQQWTDSGIDVSRGQTYHLRASGSVQLSDNQGDAGTAAGATSGRKAGNSPLPGVAGGSLIGRVNNGQPFAIGAESDVTMPSDGRLSLGINDDYVMDNRGNFTVQISQP